MNLVTIWHYQQPEENNRGGYTMKTARTKTALTTVILILLVLFTCTVYATPPENQSHLSQSRYLINIINFFTDLELTQEQKNAIQELLSDTYNEIKPLIEDMHALRTEMDEVLLAEEIDTAVAEKQILDLAALKSSMTTIALTAKLQGAQLLTREQRESILAQKVEWRERFLYWRNLFSKLFFN
jgi:Spy/CpxP family protein refolding chaperone